MTAVALVRSHRPPYIRFGFRITKKILVADTPDSDRRLSEILASHYVVFMRTLDEAQRTLDSEEFDLILVGVHFDDSRMFDLLRYLRAGERHGNRPVVCMRSHRFVSPAISIEGLEIAVKALACNLFLDFTKYADDPQGNAAIRNVLNELLEH